ncbi:hypothetical protein F4815DRAFT_433425 [Daldinia loculata]|nr:hypothetical protein F4815DRAFT_433425 [Daldinia loculata]
MMEPRFDRLVRRKKPNGRGYGPSDFEKFDRYSACCGYGQLGEVKVTTQINFKESEWGLIGADTPGAIIHMNIGFTQPEKCKLETATILVTLGSLDEIDDKAELDALERRPGLSSRVPSRVQFTHLGPVYVPGRETEMDFSRNISGTPSLSFKDASLSGLGVDQQKTYKYYNRWVFSGQLLGDDEHSGFRKLQWFLQENKLDSPSNHRPDFEAAFALIHDHNPFFIRVEIQGKLEKRLDRVKQKLQKLKYGFYGDRPLRSTLTVVNHAGIELPKRQLIAKAKNLPEKMAKRNGIIEIIPGRETEDEDSEGDDDGDRDDADSLKVKNITKRKSLRRTPQKSPKDPFISEVKRVHASLSTGAMNRTSWLSSTTLVDDDGDENTASSEQEPAKKKEADDAETLNFLLLIRFIFQYLFLQAGYVTSKLSKPSKEQSI